MTEIRRVRCGMTGFIGAPGVATFYFLDTDTAVASLKTFWDSVGAMMPATVTIQVENTGDILEDTTGEITGSWASDVVAASPGGSDGSYSAPSGAIVSWETNTYLDGRRLRGRTFVVPLSGNQYQTDGTIVNGSLTALAGFGITLITEQSDSLVVWHRPRTAKAADGSRPAVAARAGGHGLVNSCRVPDRAAVLSSRRG